MEEEGIEAKVCDFSLSVADTHKRNLLKGVVVDRGIQSLQDYIEGNRCTNYDHITMPYTFLFYLTNDYSF
jgi:hypothetical protein